MGPVISAAARRPIRVISTLYSLGAVVIHDEGRIFAAPGRLRLWRGRSGVGGTRGVRPGFVVWGAAAGGGIK
jgi:hypothetical protein